MIRATKMLCAIAIGLGAAAPADAAELARRADWQARIAPPGDQPLAEVRSIEPGSPAERAGLRPGDRIRRVDGVRTDTPTRFDDARRATRAGRPVVLEVVRGGRAVRLRFAPRGMPLEEDPGLDIVYGEVTSSRGHRLRTIVTRPAGADGKLPSLILIPWLSCSSVEVLNRPLEGMNRLLAGILRQSGFLVMRVERPGVGDSEGPACSRADLADEMAGERAALARLRAHPSFDPDRLFVLGMSLGGGRAPLLVTGEKVRGFISVVGMVKTWFEHMMEIERRRLTLSGRPAAEVNEAMRGYAELYGDYLLARRTPGQVVRRRPRLAALWLDEPGHQYGRPAAFYHQVQALNLAGAWARVRVPTLIVTGEYDWIMSQDDADIMAGLVNRNRPGLATLVRWPRASHELVQYPTRQAAFAGEGGTFDDALITLIVTWMKRQARG